MSFDDQFRDGLDRQSEHYEELEVTEIISSVEPIFVDTSELSPEFPFGGRGVLAAYHNSEELSQPYIHEELFLEDCIYYLYRLSQGEEITGFEDRIAFIPISFPEIPSQLASSYAARS